MVFSSYAFILGFLPVAYLAFLAAWRLGGWGAAVPTLALASLAFYGFFSTTLLAILVGSIAFNYAVGTAISMSGDDRRASGRLLGLGLLGNLAALGLFKYADFFIASINDATGAGLGTLAIVVPVGISFYTFTQIGFLVDLHARQVERPSFARYVLFASFFPAVTAGPLLNARDMFAQMGADRGDPAFDARRLAAGVTLFAIGLFKKIVLADGIAPFADAAFEGVAGGSPIGAAAAWTGSVAYALQLYFDFSGYSDMAVGIGAMFGLRLPINFDSPFKAASISDFWRRWHITMTRFFTTYVFSPLAMRGMRQALVAKHGGFGRWLHAAAIPSVVTFLVAGVWHGAGWTFAVYGLIHGLALAVDHGWRAARMPKLPREVGWLLTMAVVVSGLVVFRSPDLGTAGTIFLSMWTFGLLDAGAGAIALDMEAALLAIGLLGGIVMLLPNTHQVLGEEGVSAEDATAPSPVRWRPGLAWSLVVATALVASLTMLGAQGAFLYYQF